LRLPARSLFACYCPSLPSPSFPTRRSSDLAVHDGTVTSEGTGEISLSEDETATFWVYGRADGEATLSILGSGTGAVTVNGEEVLDRKSTRLNSSHVSISYAVCCLKKKRSRR